MSGRSGRAAAASAAGVEDGGEKAANWSRKVESSGGATARRRAEGVAE